MPGPIGFVGLIVPHALRMTLGPDNRVLVPAAVLAGGIFLLVADTLARNLVAPAELSVGVITSLCGAPFFVYLLRSRAGAPSDHDAAHRCWSSAMSAFAYRLARPAAGASPSDDLSFSVGAGEIFGVIGPNASGKTTLIRLLSKVLSPAQGEILLDGESLGRSRARRWPRRIAVVPQDVPSGFPYSVEELVLMGRFPHAPGRFFESDEDVRAGDEAMAAAGVLELRRETDRPFERRRAPARDAGARAVPALVAARSGRADRASGPSPPGRVRGAAPALEPRGRDSPSS